MRWLMLLLPLLLQNRQPLGCSNRLQRKKYLRQMANLLLQPLLRRPLKLKQKKRLYRTGTKTVALHHPRLLIQRHRQKSNNQKNQKRKSGTNPYLLRKKQSWHPNMDKLRMLQNGVSKFWRIWVWRKNHLLLRKRKKGRNQQQPLKLLLRLSKQQQKQNLSSPMGMLHPRLWNRQQLYQSQLSRRNLFGTRSWVLSAAASVRRKKRQMHHSLFASNPCLDFWRQS
mmetsp:Transcript_42958/g.63739  ORF Transcript_42958/g.63739 Transcript_42958/m.63739 type:complete len:225 (+) Transcript_42958:946-1620(+)